MQNCSQYTNYQLCTMSGWIKIHRSITSHWIYTEKRVFSKFEAWNDILLTVNYAESKAMIKGKIYHVKRGESILSLESWGKRWNWDKSKVRRFLNALQSDNMIVLVSDSITTRLTVCNYGTYQDDRNTDETQMKRKRNADETQTNLIKEDKEYKEDKHVYRSFGHLSISLDEFNKLFQTYSKEKIDRILDEIENNANNKKYKSLYLTAKTWLKRNEPEPETKIVDPLVEYVYKQMGIK